MTTSPIAEVLATFPDLTADQRRDLEYEIAWSWAIVRRAHRTRPPIVVRYRTERGARDAFNVRDVIRGWVLLFSPDGHLVSRRDGQPL